MSIESQRIMEIIQYMCLSGLAVTGLAAYLVPFPRWKAGGSFIIFILMAVLSFVFYAAIFIFITGAVLILVLAVLYLLAVETGGPAGSAFSRAGNKKTAPRWVSVLAAVVLCSALGYGIYDMFRDHFPEQQAAGEVFISGIDDIIDPMFSTYSLVIILLAAAALAAFTGYSVFSGIKNRKGGEKR